MDFESMGTNYTDSGAVRSFTKAKQMEGVLRTTTAVAESSHLFARTTGAETIQSVVRLERIGYDMYYGGNGRYLYQPIPKNACTKIKSLLLQIENMPVDSNWWHVHQKEYNGFPGTHNLTLEEQLDIFQGRTDTFRFVFIRNPYTRLASAYFDKLGKNIAPHIVRRIKTFAGQNRIPLSDPTTFSEFVTVVSRQSIANVADIDQHFRPQYYEGRFFIVNFDFVGRMETFPDDLIYVLERIGAPEAAVAQAHARKHETGSTVEVWDTVSADVRRLFLKAYEIDFDVLQYPQRLPALHRASQ